MLVGVSRQSITKWETGRSYPEMDKLLTLCKIFECGLDDLVQGDLTNTEPKPEQVLSDEVPVTDVCGYDKHMRGFTNRIAGGVGILILLIAWAIPFADASDPSNEHRLSLPLPDAVCASLSLLLLFSGIVILLALIIPAAIGRSQFVKSHPFIQDFYGEDERKAILHSGAYQLTGGIAAILLGVCTAPLSDATSFEAIGAAVLLSFIAAGVFFIIRGGMTMARTDIADYNKSVGEELTKEEIENLDVSPERKRELMRTHRTEKHIGALCGIIMLVATIVGLLLLFIPMGSGIFPFFWLSWVIGGILCGIVAIVLKGFPNDD